MRLSDWITLGLVGLALYTLARVVRGPVNPGRLIHVQQVAPSYVPGQGAAPAGMRWDVNHLGEWVPVPIVSLG